MQLESIGREGVCVDTYSRSHDKPVGTHQCHHSGGTQIFVRTQLEEILHDELCLDGESLDKPVGLFKCHGQQGNQKWMYNETVRIEIHQSYIFHKKNTEY